MKKENLTIISKEQASTEFEAWLDFKKVKEKKKTDNAESADEIITEIIDGNAIIKEDKTIVYTLQFPLSNGDKVTLQQLEFKPRINVREITSNLRGVKSQDVDGRILAYVTSLTGQPTGVLKGLDTLDWAFCQNIATYFL